MRSKLLSTHYSKIWQTSLLIYMNEITKNNLLLLHYQDFFQLDVYFMEPENLGRVPVVW